MTAIRVTACVSRAKEKYEGKENTDVQHVWYGWTVAALPTGNITHVWVGNGIPKLLRNVTPSFSGLTVRKLTHTTETKTVFFIEMSEIHY